MNPIIVIDELRKSYGNIVAVDGISFAVEPGTTCCLVGPNGAGKTTTVECLIGLRPADSGTITMVGLSPIKDRARVFREVGVQFQENSLYPLIKTREAIRLFASMYEQPLDPDELLALFGLQKRMEVPYKGLSGGERRKLLIAIALIGNPKVLILDEPTNGLDPHARITLWKTLTDFKTRGLTIVMTTHNMQEAEEHSDIVYMIEEGKIIAQGSSKDLLKAYHLGTRITININGKALDTQLFDHCPGISRADHHDHQLHLYGMGNDFSSSVTQILQDKGIDTYTLRPANLEDLYLMITGNQYKSNEK